MMSESAVERSRRLAAMAFVNMNPPQGLLRGAWANLVDIAAHRELLGLVARREIRAKYKDSALGLLWSLARPLVSLLIYYLVLGQFLGAARNINNFALYVFAGLTAWGLFSETINGCTVAPIANGGIIKKTRLPREIFPLAATGSALFNFMVQMVILIGGAILVGGINQNLSVRSFMYLPAAIVMIALWGLAIGMVLGALNVYLRDIQFLTEVLLTIGFWMSPVVYSWTMVSQWAADHGRLGAAIVEVYLANPATLAILALRRVMWNDAGSAVNPDHLGMRVLIALGVGLVLLFIAQRVFDRLQRNFAQEL